MKALTWQGRRDVRVETVADPTIEQPTDAIIRVTSNVTFQKKEDGAVKVVFNP
jgi:threonine dehydrogenase-like Zn-dependent dehydrogenase